MTKIRILIRHAQSLANRGDATGGDVAKICISNEGRLCAQQFAESLDLDDVPGLLVCSENLRSQQTAEIIQKVRYPDVPMEMWKATQEFHFLDLGEAYTTAAQRKPMVEQYWNDCDPYQRDPGAESWSDFYGRCVALDHKLAAHQEATFLIVSHGYVMSALTTLRNLKFPAVSSALMRLVHKTQLNNPIRNLQAITLRYEQ
jgi:broad specificity phosphatase PhoE